MAHCSTCETEYADSLSDCPACVAADEEVHHCPRCAEDYRGSDACPACGALRLEASCESHPDRQAEGRCVVCGRAVCDLEGDHRHAFLCDAHSDVKVIEGWAQIYSTTSEFEAQLVRENLRAEGIDSQIYSQKDSILSVDIGELSIVRLLVPVWEYSHALELIREHMDEGGEVVFACPGCGEAYDPGARECTGCGAPLA